MLRGHIAWWVDGQTLDVAGGDIHLTRPGEPHGGRDNIFEAMTFYGLILQLPEPDDDVLQLPHDERRALLAALKHLPRQFRGLDRLEARFADALAAAQATQTPLNASILRAKLINLLAEVIASARHATGEQPVSTPVVRALQLMRDHLHEPLPLAQIAEAIGWSLPHFKERFREQTGNTPAREYLRLRVTEAINRLTAGERVTDVAHEMGFSSSQYFATCVRRITGRPPRAFQPPSHAPARLGPPPPV